MILIQIVQVFAHDFDYAGEWFEIAYFEIMVIKVCYVCKISMSKSIVNFLLNQFFFLFRSDFKPDFCQITSLITRFFNLGMLIIILLKLWYFRFTLRFWVGFYLFSKFNVQFIILNNRAIFSNFLDKFLAFSTLIFCWNKPLE